MAAGFENPKVKTHIGAGFAFLEDNVGSFDVTITDSSDPVSECIWLHMPIIKDVMVFSRKLSPRVEYGFTTILPTYPCGQISLMVCSKETNAAIKEPVRHWPKKQEAKVLSLLQLGDPLKACFVLPQFARAALEAFRGVQDMILSGNDFDEDIPHEKAHPRRSAFLHHGRRAQLLQQHQHNQSGEAVTAETDESLWTKMCSPRRSGSCVRVRGNKYDTELQQDRTRGPRNRS
ncbi:hypothetical protein EC968_000850 [Mortierella alpina]|nr:hypothetical protein EC968_000850 [Mortierella alpina]